MESRDHFTADVRGGVEGGGIVRGLLLRWKASTEPGVGQRSYSKLSCLVVCPPAPPAVSEHTPDVLRFPSFRRTSCPLRDAEHQILMSSRPTQSFSLHVRGKDSQIVHKVNVTQDSRSELAQIKRTRCFLMRRRANQ